MAIRRTLAEFSDDIASADIADNAVTTAKIADSQITAAKVAADVATQAELDVVSTAVDNVDTSTAMKPHIRTGVLHPAVAGKGIDGSTTVTSWGTDFAITGYPTLKYYYTDIKGSKPIKDPRIGAHFGSQRHKFKSLQLLEQETATHGSNVYSIDGREWARTHGDFLVKNDSAGTHLRSYPATANNWIEITGYFNKMNWLALIFSDSASNVNVVVDGVSASTSFAPDAAVNSPLLARYVDTGSLQVLPVGSLSLGIHTVKIGLSSTYWNANGCELITHGLFTDATCDYNNDPTIAHDANTKMVVGMSVTGTGIPTGATIASVTSTTAFELSASTTGGAVTNGTLTFGVADLIIPAQNVVSYGKKFAITEVAHHYDPFNGFVNSTSLHSTFVDTATSLGLSTPIALHGAPWAISGSNNIRPYNGGRVVKWIDSAGAIKTSVNMMPANAQNQSTTAAAEITVPSATNVAGGLPAMSNDAIDHSLAEVAKTYECREFGNGAANEGSATGGTWQDASMLDGADDIGYTMDDGLTSLTSNNASASGGVGVFANGTDDYLIITFIGTGFSYLNNTDSSSSANNLFIHNNVCQNLPYGTHVVQFIRNSTLANSTWKIDGVSVATGYIRAVEFTFHQPKMPPIPEDAVVIADYMLMADFVAHTGGEELISKGVRMVSVSRDHFFDCVSSTIGLAKQTSQPGGFKMVSSLSGSGDSATMRLPYFGTDFTVNCYNQRAGTLTENLNSDVGTFSAINTSTNDGAAKHIGNNLGVNVLQAYNAESLAYDDDFYVFSSEIVTPIHTSSHYQTFETPFLHELVGGDRNMEQTNLVVTPDGKTWDEVTRDVSYLGVSGFFVSADSGNRDSHSLLTYIPDILRGSDLFDQFPSSVWQKDFTVAYDRMICLKDGQYRVAVQCTSVNSDDAGYLQIYINGHASSTTRGSSDSGERTTIHSELDAFLKRGDYLQFKTTLSIKQDGGSSTNFRATKIG